MAEKILRFLGFRRKKVKKISMLDAYDRKSPSTRKHLEFDPDLLSRL